MNTFGNKELFVASDRPEAAAVFKCPHTKTHFQKENINITFNYARNERFFRPNFRFSTDPPFWKISRPSLSRFLNFHLGTQTPTRNVPCHIQSNWSYAYQNTSRPNGLERSPREHVRVRGGPLKKIFLRIYFRIACATVQCWLLYKETWANLIQV